VFQLTASGGDVSRSRDTGHLVSLNSGQLDTCEHKVRGKIVRDMLTSERDYVKLLHDIVQVIFIIVNVSRMPMSNDIVSQAETCEQYNWCY